MDIIGQNWIRFENNRKVKYRCSRSDFIVSGRFFDRHSGVRGNPVVFPAACFPELMTLEGDRGGSAVIKRCPGSLLLVEAEARELMDVDYLSDLECLKE